MLSNKQSQILSTVNGLTQFEAQHTMQSENYDSTLF